VWWSLKRCCQGLLLLLLVVVVWVAGWCGCSSATWITGV
jgi:hypothetical protein